MHDPFRTLTEELAARRATTSGERRAASWLAEAVRRQTHLVWTESFGSFASKRAAWLLILGLALAGGALTWTAPLTATVLTTVAALAFAAEALGWIELAWLFPVGMSENVIAVLPATTEIRQRVVVVAHYDTCARPWSRSGFGMLAVGVFLLPPVVVAVSSLPWRGWDLLLLLLLVGISAGLLALPGAGREVGNAAGVAAALEAGRGPSLPFTEVWTVFTGSRWRGLVGVRALLLRHGRLLTQAGFVVLEEEDSGAGPWHRRGEAAFIAERGHRVIALLTVDQSEVAAGAARVRAVAEEIDRLAAGGGLRDGNSIPSSDTDCGTLPV